MKNLERRNYLKSIGVEFWLNEFKNGKCNFNLFLNDKMIKTGKKFYEDPQEGLIDSEKIYMEFIINLDKKKT